MARLTNQQAIVKLETAVKIAQSLKRTAKSTSSPAFIEWWHDTETAIRHIFGDNSLQVRRFRAIEYKPRRYVISAGIDSPPVDNTALYERAFVSSVGRACAIIRSMCKELVDYCPDDGEATLSGGKTTVKGLDKNVLAIHGHEVFISYSHKDDLWRVELEKHLKPYVQAGTIKSWSDRNIKTGDRWHEEIEKALARAKVAVLLVTPDFLDSDFIHENELPPLLHAAEIRGIAVVWVPISASAYHKTKVTEYQAAHSPDEPLDGLSKPEQNKAWVAICKKIEEVANA